MRFTGILILSALAFGFVGCGKKTKGFQEHALGNNTIEYQSTKWYGEDTFALRVYALGIDNPKSKAQALATCEAALRVNAAAQIVAYFNGVRIESAAGTNNAQLTGIANTAVTQGLVRYIRLHKINVAENSSDCTALAVVQQKGLKKKVDSGQFIAR